MSTQHLDDLTYALIHFDDNGKERTNDPEGGLFSATILSAAARDQPTNVFLFSHGWKGDVPSAIDQYNRWIGAMWKLKADKDKMGASFKPLFIGLHWPSQPWGDEDLASTATSFGVAGDAAVPPDLDALREDAIAHFGGGPAVREALTVIFDAQKTDPNPLDLPAEVVAAYGRLAKAVGFAAGGDPSVAPNEEGAPLDPQKAMDAERMRASFGVLDSVKKGVLSGLRQVSFWLMKNRARSVGESGMHQFVGALQQACPNASVHLMGHSFGCIVVSSILGGPGGKARLPRPINSVVLVQGAVSLWSYGDKIKDENKSGYFNGVLKNKAVAGPIVTTQSANDRAVGIAYPLAVGLVGQSDFAPGDFPLFGGVGTFGIQGTALADASTMIGVDRDYQFASGRITNLESSAFIPSHNGIDGPQMAHALWQTARTGSPKHTA